MQNKIQEWLKNPKRDYVSGLALFNALARSEMKAKYGAYFNDVQEGDTQSHSMKLNMLTNRISKISSAMKINPALYVDILATATPSTASQVKAIVDLNSKVDILSAGLNKLTYGPGRIEQFNTDIGLKETAIETATGEKITIEGSLSELKKTDAPDANKIDELEKQLLDKQEELDQLTEEKEELEQELEKLQSELDESTDTVDELQKQYEASVTEIDGLKKELEGKGLKVLSDADLPKEIKKKRERIKEIIPLMAVLHAEITVETLTDEERKAKANELCDLDDERRAAWDAVDDYLEGKDSVLLEEKKLEYSDNPIVKGMEIANRIKRLKENIVRSQKTADDPKAKPNIAVKAAKRVEEYQNQLDELESIINDAQ